MNWTRRLLQGGLVRRLTSSSAGVSITSFTTAAMMDWSELEQVASKYQVDENTLRNGPTNARATVRLFGKGDASSIKVVFYHDFHRWCPYCQKVWLWLEEKQIPYRTGKVTMFCYGEKESWYKKIVPNGMLPAVQVDGELITESDTILLELERQFGPLGNARLQEDAVVRLRRLERSLFSAWCQWLCYPNSSTAEQQAEKQFKHVVQLVEVALAASDGPYFMGDNLSAVDVIFAPFLERMNASLFHYKGYNLRGENPELSRWFDAMESRETYRGTQSDHHTHVHDLPPQMGGCYSNHSAEAERNTQLVDSGQLHVSIPDTNLKEHELAAAEAIQRVLKHLDSIVKVNPHPNKQEVEQAIHCALTFLATGQKPQPPASADVVLRYIRDRVSVPRDMSIWAARRLRNACEEIASIAGNRRGPDINTKHRRDQDPRAFNRTSFPQ